jgi:ribose transport system substrate-binding protein
MRRSVSLPALAGISAVALSAAAKPAEADQTICFVTFSLQVAYFQSSVEGGRRAAEELGVELVVLDPQADAGRQVTQLEDCIARQVDAIVVDPIESGSVMGPIEEAGAAGIPVAVLDTPIDSPHVVTQVGVPQFEASREFGQFVAGYIIGAMEGEANIGIMLASTEVQLARRDGFLEALRAVPGANIVAEGDGRNILERATAEAENMLTGNPQIDVIYATGDPQLQGGLAAAASQGRDIAFFGWDDIPEPFIAPLEDGRIRGFLKQSPDVGGEMAVRLLVDHLNGEEITPRFTYNPEVVTPYNVESFK